MHSEGLYAVLSSTENSGIVHTNCTVASFFVILLICFFPWTIAGLVSVNFGFVHNIAYFQNISLVTLKTKIF